MECAPVITVAKPVYRVPSMAEIKAIPWNGYTVASTFSGCGGSCLGYRMAGFKVVWANEFVEEARASYTPNHPTTKLDPRDIRHVDPQDILRTTGLKKGELDLFDGSPPCQSFSTAGKREKGWGKVADHADGSKQVSDDLFFEYARLLKGLQPKVFVAENVSGLVKGTAKGYFKLILTELKACGYRVEARVLDASWLGVPQARQRVIFMGVREDLGLGPVFPEPRQPVYSVVDACPWMLLPNTEPEMVATHGFTAGKRKSLRKPAPTVLAGGPGNDYLVGIGNDPAGIPTGRRTFTIPELRRLCAFPDDFVLAGSFTQQWARLGNSVPPLMMKAVAEAIKVGVLDKLPKPKSGKTKIKSIR